MAMHTSETAGEAYILRSELAKRKHAVLMPADIPCSKRQKVDASDSVGACARAQSYVPNSPLSPFKQRQQAATASNSSVCEIVGDPPDSADASSGQDGQFAVKTTSELEAAYLEHTTPSRKQHVHGERLSKASHEVTAHAVDPCQARAEREPNSGLQQQQSHQETQKEANKVQQMQQHPNSQQESTIGVGSSEPSNTSHETKLTASKDQADSPQSPDAVPPAVPPGNAEPVPELPAPMQQNQPSLPSIPTQGTVAWLLSSGPYTPSADSQKSIANKLKTYKAKVDEVHAMGRVRPTCPCLAANIQAKPLKIVVGAN